LARGSEAGGRWQEQIRERSDMDNRWIEGYAKGITAEYNKWGEAYNEAVLNGTATDQGVAAFMCNAIAAAIAKSSCVGVKEYFQTHAVPF